MAERGKHFTTYVALGSNTTIKATAGSLYSIQVSPSSNSTVVLVNSANLGATPNLNSDSLTGLIGRVGPFASTEPQLIAFAGIGFDALTVAATSNARLIVEYE